MPDTAEQQKARKEPVPAAASKPSVAKPKLPNDGPPMVLLRVTAPEGAPWSGQRLYAWAPGAQPVHVVTPEDVGELVAHVPVIAVTWAFFTEARDAQ
jgi:hypothetical protein